MAQTLKIGVSGLRGIVGEDLTAALAAEFAGAFGTFLKETKAGTGRRLSVCIGRDSRPSGQMLQAAVTAGLCGVGIDVVDLGIVTTPGVAIMTRQIPCDGGMVITASHNPAPYNGIKLLLGEGIAPPVETSELVRQHLLDKDFSFVDWAGCGEVRSNQQTDTTHLARVLGVVDKQMISARKFKVVLDSVNGSAGPVTKRLLAELGCEVTAINDEPTGLFPHAPEPTAENLIELCERVKGVSADVGFAQDPDGDRLAIVDENGSYIGEEYTLALAARYVFSKRKGPAATNLSTSRMLDDIAAEAGCRVIRTPVGEANVAAAMLEHNCIIGGEGNGGVIDLRVGCTRDSLVGIALVLQLLAETGKTISQLAGEIGGYCMLKDKFTADEEQGRRIIEEARKRFAGARLNTADGCRFDFDDGWVHLRLSNTEPVMRVVVEARERDTASGYIEAVNQIRKAVIG